MVGPRSNSHCSGHPRACGENSRPSTSWDGYCGPSPRVRGERPVVIAGHIRGSGHPRACGENGVRHLVPYRNCGPSPRVRGELVKVHRKQAPSPGHPRACGENPAAPLHRLPPAPGHPRACGDNLRGSSSRADTFRAIPARAGRTMPWLPDGFALAGHPRACGENAWLLVA